MNDEVISESCNLALIKNTKPLGVKNYGSICHLPNSRLGVGDHKVTEGHDRIATKKKRDKHDIIIVQEKLDGSNVGVALKNGKLYALARSGYEAKTSRHKMHHIYSNWVYRNEDRFRSVLKEGDRICGEWLYLAHGTKYHLPHEPFVAFDLFNSDNKRLNYKAFCDRVSDTFILPYLVSVGDSISVADALQTLGTYGKHGAAEEIEGAVWRIERNGVVDFLCKYVRPNKIDGKYLDSEVLNTYVNTKDIVKHNK